jgi:formylglycine-generating enzyme required for sulfatase activity
MMTLRRSLAFSGFRAAAVLGFCLLPMLAHAEEPACIAATGQESPAVGAGTSGSTCPEETTPLQVFRDCDVCPEMIALPMGEFMMGALEGEYRGFGIYNDMRRTAEGFYIFGNEGPQNKVVVDIPFAMGKNEVTFGEWIACVEDGWCSGHFYHDSKNFLSYFPAHPSTDATGNSKDTKNTPSRRVDNDTTTPEEVVLLVGRYPLNNVSYEHAIRYVEWLNWKTGSTEYRLPTEAEWEYAARAGTTTRFAQGYEPTPGQANLSGEWTEALLERKRPDMRTLQWPLPVDELDAGNPWGLRHMTGNVDEFTLSCYNDDRDHRIPLPQWDSTSEWLRESYREKCLRVYRGGSFLGAIDLARISYRRFTEEDTRMDSLGFRVLKEMD